MNLATKVNLILGATFVVGLSVLGLNSYLLTGENALRQVTDQAELVMQQALAVRDYTVNEIRPLLDQLDDGKFYPQIVPAYAATRTANLVGASRPGYSYKEAVFNPTNPRDRASPAEERIISRFKADPGLEKIGGSMNVDGVDSFYIAHPIRVTDSACLACHGDPKLAPAAMRAIYGDKGGFGWRLNEIVGAQMVVVPYALPAQLARKTFVSFVVSMAIIFGILLLFINLTLRKLVLRPIRRATHLAGEVGKGNLLDAEIKVTGNDEIADMSRAFNRMRRSLIKLVQILRKMQAKAKAQGQ
jgi:protein-histidine pros-kinase